MLELMGEIGVRILEILLVPYFLRDMIWTIAPLVFALVMLQMYFGRYKTEQLGWNTAFANTISLMWVTLILFKHVHERYGLLNAYNDAGLRGYVTIIAILALITLILTVLNYTHKIPKQWAFVLSSSLPINALAYFAIVIVMGRIPLDRITLFAAFTIFIFLAIIFHYYKKMITPSKSALQTLKRHEEEHKKIVRKRKRKIKRWQEKLKMKWDMFRLRFKR